MWNAACGCYGKKQQAASKVSHLLLLQMITWDRHASCSLLGEGYLHQPWHHLFSLLEDR